MKNIFICVIVLLLLCTPSNTVALGTLPIPDNGKDVNLKEFFIEEDDTEIDVICVEIDMEEVFSINDEGTVFIKGEEKFTDEELRIECIRFMKIMNGESRVME